jgi:HK97 family phage major capsid protein
MKPTKKRELPEFLKKRVEAEVAKRVSEEMARKNANHSEAPREGGEKKSLNPAETKVAVGLRLKQLWSDSPMAASTKDLKELKGWVTKAAGAYASVFGQGGSLLAEQYSSEIIELLRPRAVLVNHARGMNFDSTMNIGRLNGGAVAAFVDEGKAPPESNLDTGAVVLEGHKLMAIYDASNDLLRRPSVDAASILSDDLMQALATTADAKGYTGDGTGPNPVGIVKQVKTENKVTLLGELRSSNITNVIDWIDALVQRVRKSNLPFQENDPFWSMSSKMEQRLKGLRDNSGWVYRLELNDGMLAGHPVEVTENVSEDFITFGLGKQLVFGLDGEMAIEMGYPEFKKDVTTIRGVQYVDWKLRHNSSFAYSDGVKY